jgi:Domain of unknown function (DUF6443)
MTTILQHQLKIDVMSSCFVHSSGGKKGKMFCLMYLFIFINCAKVYSQECNLNVPGSAQFSYQGGAVYLPVDKTGFCFASFQSYPTWISTVYDYGSNIAITALQNSGTARSGTLVMTYDGIYYYITLSQDAYVTPVPVITQHPAYQTKCEGQTALFSIISAYATSYQWQESNDNSSYSNISGQNSANLSFSTSDGQNNKWYRCVASNPSGSIPSSGAKLTVNPITQIVGHPVDITVCQSEGSVSFSIVATGNGNTYSWERKLPTSSVFSTYTEGADGQTVTITDITTNINAQFRCVVSGACAGGTSNPATLRIISAQISMGSPADQTICPGKQAMFSVSATGEGLTYQWQERTNISNNPNDFYNISGETSPTYQFVPSFSKAGYQYRCMVFGNCGFYRESDYATLSFLSSPHVTMHPSNVSICPSRTAYFEVSGADVGLYQWQHKLPGSGTFVNSTAPGAVTNKVTAELIDGIQYQCILTGGCSPSVASLPASLTIKPVTQVLGHPVDVLVTCSTEGSVSFSVGASGIGVTYSWERKLPNSTVFSTYTEGAGGQAVTITSILENAGAQFRCVVSGACGGGTSNPATLIYEPTQLEVNAPADQTICPGAQAIFSVSATGNGLSYQWQENTNISNNSADFQSIVGATSATYSFSPPISKAGYKYRCVVTEVSCNKQKISDYCVLEFYNVSGGVITNHPKNVISCEQETVKFVVEATGEDLRYQWLKSVDHGVSFSEMAGETSSILSILVNGSFDGYQYKCKVSIGVCVYIASTSNPATLSVPHTLPGDGIVSSSSTFSSHGEDVLLVISQATHQLLEWYTINDNIEFVIGKGDSVLVSPLKTMTYYVRAGDCSSGSKSITIARDEKFSRRHNYIYNLSSLIPMDGGLKAKTGENTLEEIVYFDGLGRKEQAIQIASSPLNKDIIQPFVYDLLGRESFRYLPFTDNKNGLYYEDIIDRNTNKYKGVAQSFYTEGSEQIAMDEAPYVKTLFDDSPLNRVLKQGAPGATWQPNTDPYSMADNTVKKRYETNAAEEVFLFLFDSNTGLVSLGTVAASRYYGANQLYANKTYDEHNNEVIEYVDKEGRTVCKKVKASTTEYASTYYLYDDLGNLVVVLPPEAVKKLGMN